MIEAIASFVAHKTRWALDRNFFISFMPDKPTECCAIYQYKGGAPLIEQGTGVVLVENHSFQVKVRGTNYPETLNGVREVFNCLCSEASNFDVIPFQSPFPLGWDKECCSFIFNFRIQHER